MKGKLFVFGAVIGAVVADAAWATDPDTSKIITSQEYVDAKVALKQPMLEKKSTANFLVTYPVNDQNDPGYATNAPTSREIVTSLSTDAGDAAKVPTVGAVNAGLATKQDNIGGGTANTVITNTGTAGQVGSKPVYNDQATYTGTNTTALIQANHANDAIQNGLNAHVTCGAYATGHTNDADYCTLYNINTLSGPYTTHAVASQSQD